MAEVADFPWLQRRAAIALECVSLRDDEPAVVRTIQAAMAVGELRARWLRPEAVFDAAARPDVDDAHDALSVFTVETQWREAALLRSLGWRDGRGAHAR